MSQQPEFYIGQVFQTPPQEFETITHTNENGEEVTEQIPIPLPWTGYPPEAAGWCNENNCYIEDTGNGTYTIMAVEEPPVLSLHDQAMLLSMPKLEFITLAEVLTAGMPTPITWALIRAWMNENPEIDKLFTLATEVVRADPLLEPVTAQFGEQFLPFLDMMFVERITILDRIKQTQIDGTVLNLDDLLIKWGIIYEPQ